MTLHEYLTQSHYCMVRSIFPHMNDSMRTEDIAQDECETSVIDIDIVRTYTSSTLIQPGLSYFYLS